MTPSCGAVLSAFGAEIIKIEPAGSADATRGGTVDYEGVAVEPSFELFNNRKRGIQLNLDSEAGREVLHRLLRRADIFLTNVRQPSLEKAGIDPESVHERYPQLVIAHGTGHGPLGAERDRPSFDDLAYWSRGGIADGLRVDDGPPVEMSGSMGDPSAGVAMVAGVLMALLQREREGRGAIVDVSLYANGLWTNGWNVQRALLGRRIPRKRSRWHARSPLYTMYQCMNDEWVQFAMFQTDRFWRPVCEALGREDLIDDERFSTFEALHRNNSAAIAELQETIGVLSREELGRRLDEQDLPWAPIFGTADIVRDEQARVNGFIVSKRHRSGREIEVLAPPFQLRGQPPQMEPAPELGQHTEEVLLELEYGWDDIASLRERGAF